MKIVFFLILTFLMTPNQSSMNVGIYIQQNVSVVGNNLSTYSDATQNNSTKSAVNIFLIFHKNGQRNVQIVPQLEFWIQNPLLVALCHSGFDTSKLKNPQNPPAEQEPQPSQSELFDNATKSGCKVVKNSQIFFNIAQMSPVQYQKSAKGQRYSYGGLRYFTNLVGSEIVQNLQKTFAKKQGANNPGKLVSENLIAEGFIKDNLISGTFLSTIGDYKILKELIEGQRDNEICWFDFGDLAIEDIETVSVHRLHSRNVLVIKHKTINQLKSLGQVNISEQQHPNQPILIKFLQNIGMAGYRDMFDINQQVEVLNLEIKFKLEGQNKFSAQITANDDSSTAQQQIDLQRFQEWSKQKNVEVQVMACNGLIKLKNQQKMLDLLQVMGCEKVATVDSFFSVNKPDNKPDDKQKLLKIQGFKTETMQLKTSLRSDKLQKVIDVTGNQNINTNPQSIKIEGFKQNCDTILDKFLGVIFIICYLKYSFEGDLFSGVSELEEQELQEFVTGVISETNMLQGLDLLKFKMEERIQTSQTLSDDECKKCFQAFFPCRISVIAKFFNTSFKAICTNKNPICAIFQTDGPLEYTRLTPEETKTQIKKNFRDFDSIVKNIASENAPKSINDVKTIIENSELQQQIEQAQEYILQQVESFAIKNRVHLPSSANLRIQRLQKAELYYQKFIGLLQEQDKRERRIII